MKKLMALLFLIGICNAQLVQKKEPIKDAVMLTSPSKMEYSKNNEMALDNATKNFNTRNEYKDSTMGEFIGNSAELFGEIVKEKISPNTEETKKVEMERARR